MRANALVLLLIPILLAVGPARADELFRHGPVSCAAASPDVTALTVGKCRWQKAPGGGFYSGSCDGSVAIKGKQVQFNVYGEARRVDYVYPDNDTPLTFAYRGLNCAVQSPRLKAVQNCRATASGKECQVCAITAAKVCFNVKVDVSIKTAVAVALRPQPVSAETVGAIAGQ